MSNNLRKIYLEFSKPVSKRKDVIYMIMKPAHNKMWDVELISNENFMIPAGKDNFIVGKGGYWRCDSIYKNLTPKDCLNLAEKIKELNTIEVANKRIIIDFSGLLKKVN